MVLQSNFLMYVTEPCSQRDDCVCNECIDSHVFDIVMMFYSVMEQKYSGALVVPHTERKPGSV